MEKVRGGFQTLYHREEPHHPGLPMATHFDSAEVNDEVPSEAEVEAAVIHLRLYRAGSYTKIRAEYFKQWQREA